jgi:hypothetical protein
VKELDRVLKEFDSSDPEFDEGLLKTAFSTLIDEGFITGKAKAKDVGLNDLMCEIFGEYPPEDLIERAQTFDNLIDTYVGEPSEDDVEEAKDHLERIVNSLRKKADGLEQKTLREEGLWRNT